ncbi:MAG: hypothetical protein PHT38_07080 [Halothiobacillus sp.]|nr:hypothetical protein [Halothiobacillus sp.]
MSQKFELHYYFGDDTHTMNALVRNECERELLALFKECSYILGIECSIESEAAQEGGLREIWNFVGSPHAALLVAVLALVMSRFPPTDNAKEEQEEHYLSSY